MRPLPPLVAALWGLFLLSAAVALPAPPAQARQQRVRPAFEPKLTKRMVVSGTVKFRIVGRRDGLPHEFAPVGSGGWVAVVRIDGHPVASLKRLPGVVEWDTREAGDGIHSVTVGVRNPRGDQEVGSEGAEVVVDNAAADSAAEAAEDARGGPAESQGPKLVLKTPDAAKVTTLAPRLSRSTNPLAGRATALLPAGERLYLGLPDGGVAYCAPSAAGAGGSVVRLPAAEVASAGPVRSLAAGGGRVWWVGASGRTVYAYGLAGRSLSRYEVTGTLSEAPPLVAEPVTEPSPEPVPPATEPAAPGEPPVVQEGGTAPVLSPAPSAAPKTPARPAGWVRRVAVLRGRVLLLGDAVRVLDPRTGALSDPAVVPGLLPAEALTAAAVSASAEGDSPRLFVSASPAAAEGRPGAPAMVVAVSRAPRPEPGASPTDGTTRRRRWVLRAWRAGKDGAWGPVTEFPTDADPDRAAASCIAASPEGLATAEREGPRSCVTSSAGGATPFDMPYALSPGMPSSTDRVAVGSGAAREAVWWEQRGIVFRDDPRTGARDCFLPWNIPGGTGKVLALAADDKGLWVATTSAGVRRIRPGRPSAKDGYGGYIRARLGEQTMRPPTPRAARVADAIEEWQGVPYVWGGQSPSGTDCSGYLLRIHQVGGVSIPRTTVGMRHSSRGPRVRDELRWGDTLVFPGHCALYVGDGRTSETVGGSRGGSVSGSSIWVRGNVVVRRFLR